MLRKEIIRCAIKLHIIHYRLPNDFEISKIVHDHGFVPKWIRTSAKTGEGVNDAFNLIVRYVMAMDSWSAPMLDPDEFSFTSGSSLSLTPNVSGFNNAEEPEQDIVLLKNNPLKPQHQQCLC